MSRPTQVILPAKRCVAITEMRDLRDASREGGAPSPVPAEPRPEEAFQRPPSDDPTELVTPESRVAPEQPMILIDAPDTPAVEATSEESRDESPDPAPPAKRTPRRKPSRAKEERRDFVIAYDGDFIGHFRSARWITNRSAFRSIARQIMGQIGDDFDPTKLALYKPVLLNVPLTESREELQEGSFTWFSA